MEIFKGCWVHTPRFLKVEIKEVYESQRDARKDGYIEPTHYDDHEHGILGKSTGRNMMIFAAYKK